MVTFVKSPCDEAAILTALRIGRCRPRPLGAGGHDSWIESRVHRRHRRERGPSGSAVRARRIVGRRPVGRRILRADAGSPAPDRRRARRSPRPPPGLCRRRGHLRRGVGVVRPFPNYRRAHRGARRSGSGCCAARAGQPLAHQRIVSGGSARPRDRHMVRIHRDHRCARSRPWGMARPTPSWRWIFFINLPLALAVLAITIWRVPETRAAHPAARLDWPGVVLATAGLGASCLD